VHVSQLSDRYVTDPNQVVTVGQRVKVRVMSVDLQRNRIALTMKSAASTDGRPAESRAPSKAGAPQRGTNRTPPQPKPFTVKPGAVAPNGMRFK
jgi:uncharacterized protein